MTTPLCSNCGNPLLSNDLFCPKCGASTSRSDLSTVPQGAEQKVSTKYGTPSQVAPLPYSYSPSSPYGSPLQAPPPPKPARKLTGTRLVIGILTGVIVLLVLSGIIVAIAFTQRQGGIQATATTQAQSTAMTHAQQVTATTQAQLGATA